MKRGTSPIKTKILSDFMHKLSGKKEDKPSSNQKSNLNLSSNLKEPPKQPLSKLVRSTENANLPKPSLEKSIDDILGFGHSAPSSRYTTKTKQQAATISINRQSEKSKQLAKKQQQVSSDIADLSQSVLNQTAKSGTSSTSMVVNNSSMKLITKPQDKFISPPIKALKFEERKSDTSEIKINIAEKKSISDSEQANDTQLKSKIQQIQNLTKEKSFFIDKVSKLQQDLNRKEKELTRRVNEINSTTLQRQVVVNFLSNLADKMSQFLSKKQAHSEKELKANPDLMSKSLNKSIGSRSQSQSSNKSFSGSKVRQQKSELESISEDKEISLVESINVKLLDELIKSMQKGLSRSEVTRKSQELVAVFKKLLMQLKRSEQTLVSNVRGEYSKVEKEFESQKQTINRIQKQYQTEKSKNEKLQERQKSLSDQLQQIQNQHNKCLPLQSQLAKELQTVKSALSNNKQDLVKKDNKISELGDKLKAFEKLPNSHSTQIQQLNHSHSTEIQQIKRNYEKKIKEKDAEMLGLKKNHQKEINLKLSEGQNTKSELSDAYTKVESLEKTITQKQAKVSQLQQQLTQRQSTIKQHISEQTSLKGQLQKHEKEKGKFDIKLTTKQKLIEELNLNISKKDKRLFELEFTSQQINLELNALRAETKQLQLSQVRLIDSEQKLKEILQKTEQEKSLNMQQAKRWKSSYQKTQQQLLNQIKSYKTYELSAKKQINKLEIQLQSLTENLNYMKNKISQLQGLNMEQEKKLIIYEASQNIQDTKNIQSQSIYQELTQIQISRYTQLMQEKQKTWKDQLRITEHRYLQLKQNYWTEKQLSSRLQVQLQAKNSQNLHQSNKIHLYIMAIDLFSEILDKTLSSSTNSLLKHSNLILQTDENQKTTVQKQNIDMLIYEQNPQMAKSLRKMKSEHKRLYQLITLTCKLQKSIHQRNLIIQKLQNASHRLLQPVIAFNLELVASGILEKQTNTWMSDSFTSIESAIEGLEYCFGTAVRSRNKLQGDTSVKVSIAQIVQAEKTIKNYQQSNKKSNIDTIIVKSLSGNQAEFQQFSFPNYTQKLHQLIKNMLTKLNADTNRRIALLTSKHQTEAREVEQGLRRQIEQMEHQLNRLREQIDLKEQESHHTIQTLKHQQYEPRIKSLEQTHLSFVETLNKQFETHYQQLKTQFHTQMSAQSQTLASHLHTITSLEHELSFQIKISHKLQLQINELKRNLSQQSQQKTKLSAQLHTLKIELYNLKEYQTPKLQERCLELETSLHKKTEQLNQAYLIVHNHLASH